MRRIPLWQTQDREYPAFPQLCPAVRWLDFQHVGGCATPSVDRPRQCQWPRAGLDFYPPDEGHLPAAAKNGKERTAHSPGEPDAVRNTCQVTGIRRSGDWATLVKIKAIEKLCSRSRSTKTTSSLWLITRFPEPSHPNA